METTRKVAGPTPPSRDPAGAPGARQRTARRVRIGAWTLGLLPLALLLWETATQGLGSNPIEKVLHHTGWWGLFVLVLSLAVTPLRRWTGVNSLIQARRTLGLFAFFYIALHVVTYVGLDQFFAWGYILEDVLERPFITVGMLSFLLLLPLAITSTRGWIRRLGRNWTRLHRLVYPAAILGVIHYIWGVKTEALAPFLFAAVVALLLGTRLYFAFRKPPRPSP